ncbi:unnamed protein product [Paramecium pentaurelia]|uniref:Uncharacterized protein n=1 Tax=Paramecium pentaurelia TaxID=43138 RepID=A0A8S1Y5T3_9CILI|nr:unnamed protein product [Paramecium pentaurelia]
MINNQKQQLQRKIFQDRIQIYRIKYGLVTINQIYIKWINLYIIKCQQISNYLWRLNVKIIVNFHFVDYCLRKKTIYRQSSFKIEIEYNLAYYLDVISLSCIFKCSICINNLFLQCNYGYYLNRYNNLCETLCGDSINQGNEQCDDGNSDNYDGCSNCELIQYEKCDIEQDIQKYCCAVCYYGKCLKCNEGFLLNGDLCISICWDGLINPIEEECDVQSGDGCIDCKIQNGYVCDKLNFSTCKTCDKEINLFCKSCIDEYYNVEDQCQLCDSNCINCKLQSNLYFCESIPGLFGDIKTKQCNSICGDGIVAESYEQCDDNNQNNGDGCDSQCNLEFSDIEINKMKYYLSQTNNTYDLKLNSEYQFKILCNTINIIIDNMDIQDYNYNYTQVDVLTCSLKKFDFKKSIYKFNTIHAKLLYTNSINRILSENDRSILYDITPNDWINNFYFLNVNYPFNVELFFLSSDLSNLIGFPTYQGLNQPDCNYYFEAPKRFKDKGIYLLFINLQVPFMFLLSSIIIFLINYLLYSFFSLLNDALKIKIPIKKEKHFSIFYISIKKQNRQNSIKVNQQ